MPIVSLSGNEITDTQRTVNDEGDGASPGTGAGTGIYRATTNLVTNGSFETDTSGWSAIGGGAVARTTADKKFGLACGDVTTGATDGDGIRTASLAVNASQTHAARVWVKVVSGGDVRIQLNERTAADASVGTTEGTTRAVNPGEWTELRVVRTFGATGVKARVNVLAQANSEFYLDGVSLEDTKDIPTAFVKTDGATASRSAARVQIPASLLDETQMWAAFRFSWPFASSELPDLSSTSFTLFDWRDDANNYLNVHHRESSSAKKTFAVDRNNGGAAAIVYGPGNAFAAGDHWTVIATWTAALVGVSVNGEAFTTAANTVIPTLAATLADIGSQAGTLQFDAPLIWVAFDTGALSDADAASIYALGDTPPSGARFFTGGPTQFVW